jgi:hypothetical protein
MFAVLQVLAETTSAEAEPSKAPFYIAGGLLVLFAIVVSTVGIRSETFPPTKGARTLVMGVGAILVAAAMATAVLTS